MLITMGLFTERFRNNRDGGDVLMLDCEALTKAFDKTLFKNLDIHLGPGRSSLVGSLWLWQVHAIEMHLRTRILGFGNNQAERDRYHEFPEDRHRTGRPVLYPHLSVSGNLSLASKSGHEEALEEVGLSGFEGRAIPRTYQEEKEGGTSHPGRSEPDVLLG